jgi:hypothetical protein
VVVDTSSDALKFARYPIAAKSSIMSPSVTRQLIALYVPNSNIAAAGGGDVSGGGDNSNSKRLAGGRLQVFDIQGKKRLREQPITTDLIFWRWLPLYQESKSSSSSSSSPMSLAVITPVSVAHWQVLDSELNEGPKQPPKTCFQRYKSANVSLQLRRRIMDYAVSSSRDWCLLMEATSNDHEVAPSPASSTVHGGGVTCHVMHLYHVPTSRHIIWSGILSACLMDETPNSNDETPTLLMAIPRPKGFKLITLQLNDLLLTQFGSTTVPTIPFSTIPDELLSTLIPKGDQFDIDQFEMEQQAMDGTALTDIKAMKMVTFKAKPVSTTLTNGHGHDEYLSYVCLIHSNSSLMHILIAPTTPQRSSNEASTTTTTSSITTRAWIPLFTKKFERDEFVSSYGDGVASFERLVKLEVLDMMVDKTSSSSSNLLLLASCAAEDGSVEAVSMSRLKLDSIF